MKENETLVELSEVEDMCHSCENFNICDYDCKKGYYLDGESEKFTIECDDYEEMEQTL